MKTLLALLVLFSGFYAHAGELSAFAGLNSTEFDSDGGSWDREFGWEFGATYVHPMQDKFSFRSGAGVVQKASKDGVKVEFLFMEIPATVVYSINNNFRVFGGLNFDVTLADDGAKSKAVAVNLPVGGRYNWGGPSSVEGILEFGVTDFADGGAKINNSLSVRYLYDFTVNFK